MVGGDPGEDADEGVDVVAGEEGEGGDLALSEQNINCTTESSNMEDWL